MTEGITMDQSAIEAIGLTKHYGTLSAVDDISFRVGKGEVFGFLGPNGAGKTTTIRMLVGLTSPSEGTAMVAGHSITDDIVEVKRRVGVVPEVSNLYDELSVWDNLLFMSQLYHVPRKERRERIEDVLQSFDLQSRRGMKFGKLSKGLKRRVVIGAALVHSPEIVFMDEPTVGLDVVSAQSLREFIEQLGDNDTTVFLTTHYIEEADRLCDRIAIIMQGKILVTDTPVGIKKRVETQPVIRAELSSSPSKSLLSKLDELGELEHEGCIINLRVQKPSDSLPLIINTLSSEGASVEVLETVRGTLEEAFVELTGCSPDSLRAEKGGGKR
jgi:ABC-2 type transport system ATP-binding protein